ncbi:sulfotransferase [Oceanisphaera sp.]|uniref:sulfotransferase n=1 Tax=Oceanisphaera sp. TaxID=1929979 RepID=UPI003A8DD959
MAYLNILRQLADQQQYELLQANAQGYLDETGDHQVLPLLALAHAHMGARSEAEAVLDRVQAAREPLALDARVDLAGVYCLLGRIDEAEAVLEHALASEPGHALALARLAWCRLQQGQLAQACTLYQRSAAIAPQRLLVWMALTRLQLQACDYLAAQQALDSAISRIEATITELPEGVAREFTAQLRGLQLEIWVATDALAQAEQWLDARRETLPEDEWCGLVLGYSTLLAGKERHAESEEALGNGLKYYPHNLALISQLAELAQLQGRTMQAVQLLRRSIRLAKTQDDTQQSKQIGLWVRLSSACLQQLDQQARHAADKAIELADALQESETTPEAMIRQLRLQARNALAQVESQTQNFDVADVLFRALLDEAPYFLPALQGLGQQQMQRGNIDEAVELFERIKQIDPAKGYSSLINARRFPDDEATLEKIERAARQPSLEGEVRSGLLLQLAAAWEKRQDYDTAFALAREANNASKKRLSYDAKAHRNQCARIRHAFCKALYQHRPERGVDSTLPVFVLGMPRSGTTLVEQILAGHSRIFGAGELGVIPSRIQGLNRWERHVGSGRSYPDCVDDLTPYVSAGIANGILDELRELAATDKPEACHVVDKLPHNFENIGLIKFLFPHARIISVRRDPRDIAISNYFTDYQAKHGGMGFAYDLTWIGEQLADHNMMMHHWQQLFPGEILEINYEDVVEDLEGSARKMLDYIGVDWEPQVLAFNELDRPVKTASVWQVRQPVYNTSKAKWLRYKNQLTLLIAGTNAKICPEPIDDMISLPEPGFLTDGVALFRQGDLDGAELSFKKMLHHNPDHAACRYMVGLIYLQKGHLQDGIEFIETALEKAPWQKEWRENLIKAYELVGEPDKAAAMQASRAHQQADTRWTDNMDLDTQPMTLSQSD